MQISAAVVGGCSLVATAATVANAFLIKHQFYPAIVYLTRSNASMAVIYFQAITIVFMLFQVLKRIFFGQLRAAETEHLSERAWHAVLETCLAFTVFRDDFSPIFVMQFVMLLFVKCFHWLADDRVDVMERSPLITLGFHIRMLAIIGCLAAVDSYLISHAYFSIMLKGASSQLVFGFEYAILMTLVIHVAIKYILHMHDLRNAQTWEGKAVYLLYAELIMNLARCLLYGAFALLMIRLHTFPLFSIRPFYLSIRALHKALNDVIMSRRAIAAMNTMFPVVSSADLENIDTTCIICREEMTAESHPKRLPCSHVFHSHCLRSWFQRQQTCPTCRTDILGRAQNPREARPAPAAAPRPAAEGQPPFVPFVAHQFAFHAAPQPQQVPNQRVPEEQRNGEPAQAPQHNPFGHAFPGFMAPMGLLPPIPPPMPPMPTPPPSALHGLSDEELSALEGNTRDAVINRIRMLQDVSTLLDAVDVLMSQYSRASGSSFQSVNLSQSTANVPTTSDVNEQPSTSQSSSSPETMESDLETDSPVVFSNSDVDMPGPSGVSAETPSSADSSNAQEEDEKDLVRQRRMKRFATTSDES